MRGGEGPHREIRRRKGESSSSPDERWKEKESDKARRETWTERPFKNLSYVLLVLAFLSNYGNF